MFGCKKDYIEMELHDYKEILKEREKVFSAKSEEWRESKKGEKYISLTAEIEEKIENLEEILKNF